MTSGPVTVRYAQVERPLAKKTALDLLQAARKRLDDPARWLHGVPYSAADVGGRELDADDPTAARWDVYGAILVEKSGDRAIDEAIAFVCIAAGLLHFKDGNPLQSEAGFGAGHGLYLRMVEWHDAPDRRHAEVMAVLELAAISAGPWAAVSTAQHGDEAPAGYPRRCDALFADELAARTSKNFGPPAHDLLPAVRVEMVGGGPPTGGSWCKVVGPPPEHDDALVLREIARGADTSLAVAMKVKVLSLNRIEASLERLAARWPVAANVLTEVREIARTRPWALRTRDGRWLGWHHGRSLAAAIEDMRAHSDADDPAAGVADEDIEEDTDLSARNRAHPAGIAPDRAT